MNNSLRLQEISLSILGNLGHLSIVNITCSLGHALARTKHAGFVDPGERGQWPVRLSSAVMSFCRKRFSVQIEVENTDAILYSASSGFTSNK